MVVTLVCCHYSYSVLHLTSLLISMYYFPVRTKNKIVSYHTKFISLTVPAFVRLMIWYNVMFQQITPLFHLKHTTYRICFLNIIISLCKLTENYKSEYFCILNSSILFFIKSTVKKKLRGILKTITTKCMWITNSD